MKYIQRFVAILILVLALVSMVQGSALSAEKAAVQLPPPEMSYKIPYNPHIAQKEATYPDLKNKNIVFFDSFAWQTFAALNWPANCQGDPLKYKKIGDDPYAPRVWEFYRLPEEIFLQDGKDPTTIQPRKPFQCNDAKDRSNKYLTEQITESGLLAGKDEMRSNLKDISIPLVDQQSNYVINETHINSEEFNQIVAHKWFDARNLTQFSDNDFNFACSNEDNSQSLKIPCGNKYSGVGAIAIKAAWRVFDERNSAADKAHYYTTKQQVLIPEKISATGKEFKQEVDLGLIGFHIMQKTSEQGWIWSTFEQVDNVPNGSEQKGSYTLYNSNNSNCEKDCTQNNSKKPYLWRQETPHAVSKNEGKIIEQIPSQITRLTETELTEKQLEQVEALNEQWQNALKPSIWQYYKLIGAAWLTNPQTPYGENRVISPTKWLVNVALEPFSQKASCIACHTSAKLPNGKNSDFNFLMSHAKSSNSSTVKQKF